MITVFKDVITLITVEKVSDGAGGYENKPGTKRTVFANKKSATRSEFYLAQQADLEVEVVFTIYTSEYNDEQVIEHNNQYYSVIRTFEKGDFIELTCQKRIGGLDEVLKDD